VLDAYGTTEASLIGRERPCAAGLHVRDDLLIPEVVDDNDRPAPAQVKLVSAPA
jgi:phenylacetate-coenzyme A ligase PaaK-like adenylate-forming protein